MQASQGGAGAYSQLLFDDSPGQARVALQRHAAAHKGTDELNLGHPRHQADNQRLQAVGFGAELKTEHSAALRAGQGMLLSADRRIGASGSQMDSREAHAQISASRELQQALATTAQKHNAMMKDEPEPAKLAALAHIAHSASVVKNGQGASGGQGQVTAYGEPHLQLSTPAGIVATTPADTILAAGHTGSISAGQDINFAAQGNAFSTVKGGISLFTYGKAGNKDKPNQEVGIMLHAASGKVSSQSQSDATKLTADKAITVASMTKGVTIAAKKHLQLTAQGAYLKLEGGNIMIHGPGTMLFNASMKELAGPVSVSLQTVRFPKYAEPIAANKPIFSQQFDLSHLALNHHLGFSSEGLPYEVFGKNGQLFARGNTNENGMTERVVTNDAIDLVVLIGDGLWQVEEHFEGRGLSTDETSGTKLI